MTSCKCNSGTSSEVCGRFGRWGVCWLDFGQHEWENLEEALYFHQEEGKRSRLASASPEQSRDCVTKGSPPTRFGHPRWAPCPLADLKASDHSIHPTRLCSKIHVLLLKQEGLFRGQHPSRGRGQLLMKAPVVVMHKRLFSLRTPLPRFQFWAWATFEQ